MSGDKIEFLIESKAEYLLITCHSGVFTFAGIRTVIDQIKQAAERQHCSRVLVDLRPLGPPLTGLDQFQSGRYLAEIFGGQVRVAALAGAKDINRFGENVAVNRGADFSMFSEPEPALSWLLRA